MRHRKKKTQATEKKRKTPNVANSRSSVRSFPAPWKPRRLFVGVILPAAKSLYLCDGHLGFSSGKTDLMGVFDSMRPQGGYPHIHPFFVVFARLAQGHGTIPFRVGIRLAATGQFVAWW
jgi:hypothetical protein